MKDSPMDRQALTYERADLQRQREKRVQSNSPHSAAIAMIDERAAVIDALLAAPEPRSEPEEPTATESLAGRTLGDPDASPVEKSLAASLLARAGD